MTEATTQICRLSFSCLLKTTKRGAPKERHRHLSIGLLCFPLWCHARAKILTQHTRALTRGTSSNDTRASRISFSAGCLFVYACLNVARWVCGAICKTSCMSARVDCIGGCRSVKEPLGKTSQNQSDSPQLPGHWGLHVKMSCLELHQAISTSWAVGCLRASESAGHVSQYETGAFGILFGHSKAAYW